MIFNGTLPVLGEVTVYLHHYLRSDPDRGVHDHPWPWAVAMPLAGGYREERLVGLGGGAMNTRIVTRLPGVPYVLTGNDFHRVIVDEGKTNWSLFATGRNGYKPWGMLRPELVEGSPQEDYPGAITFHPTFFPSWRYHAVKAASASRWWESAPLGQVLQRAAP